MSHENISSQKNKVNKQIEIESASSRIGIGELVKYPREPNKQKKNENKFPDYIRTVEALFASFFSTNLAPSFLGEKKGKKKKVGPIDFFLRGAGRGSLTTRHTSTISSIIDPTDKADQNNLRI